MRTIKFRGKRIDNKEWVYGHLYKLPLSSGDACMILTQDNIHLDTHLEPKYHLAFTLWVDLFIVDPATVGQFTGLHDKNGNEIYEGDIIKWYEIGHSDHDVLEPPEDYIRECVDVVEFHGGTFCVGREEAPSPIPVEFLTEAFQANEDDMFKWVYNTDEYPNITIDDMYICEVIGNIHDNPELFGEE